MHNYIRDVLAFHHVKEAVASKIVNFVHIDSKMNPEDMLSKHWGYQRVQPMLKPYCFMNKTQWISWMKQQFQPMGSDKVLLRSMKHETSHKEILMFVVLL